MCVYVLFPSLTYIALQLLGVFDLSLTSLTYIALHSMKMRMTSLTSLHTLYTVLCLNYNIFELEQISN